ncbi:hypothetical protein [Acinetobacter bereziniae]|uniref:hypothetical protein n=1 Tax=Acinetobacter bereziniae TaxID=106648 RepID=UPI003AF5A113
MKAIFKDFILPILPSILTIIGWWIVGTRDNNSKKNAIHNRRVDLASELIEKIFVDAKKFYSLQGSDVEAKTLNALIISDFKKLSSIINLVTKKLSDYEKHSVADAFITYKKTITGGSFESINRAIVKPTNQLYVEIDTTYNDLYIELEKIYLS